MRKSLLYLVTFSCMAVCHAQAGERFAAQGMFCRTAESATTFVKTWNRHNAAEASRKINEDAGKTMCSLGTILLEEVERTDKLTLPTGTWQLVKINIWGSIDSGVAVTYPDPIEGYTYVEVQDPEKLGQAI